MRNLTVTASLLAAMLAAQPASADVIMVPTGGGNPKPVPMHPVDPKDSPEEIAKDAARDLKDSQFYNKPGATRAQYDQDWQECRLIARGSKTPAGMTPVYYNPAVVSPVAAGVGGALGGMIGAAIAEGAQRRANRRACLLIRGWRLVKVPDAVASKVAAMSDADRNNYLNQIVGAQTVEGEITERKSFSLPSDGLANVNNGLSGPEALFFGKKVDASAPFSLAPSEAAVVLAYRRPGDVNAGRFVQMNIARYDPETRDLVYQPRDWKKTGDKTTYNVEVPSGDRKAGLEVQVLKLTPGDYVISAVSWIRQVMSTNCFGAPTFHVSAGQVLYLGDFVPVWNATGADGKKISGTGYVSRIDDARRVLNARQPRLAAAMQSGKMLNGATYACAAATMDRWDLAGVEHVAEPLPTVVAQPAAADAIPAS